MHFLTLLRPSQADREGYRGSLVGFGVEENLLSFGVYGVSRHVDTTYGRSQGTGLAGKSKCIVNSNGSEYGRMPPEFIPHTSLSVIYL